MTLKVIQSQLSHECYEEMCILGCWKCLWIKYNLVQNTNTKVHISTDWVCSVHTKSSFLSNSNTKLVWKQMKDTPSPVF